MKFLGDRDSKNFPAVEDIYEGAKFEKLECIGHVQKRVGNRLRNLKKNVKGFGGRGRLTNNIIDKLQNYYSMAIRQNSGDLNAMRSATDASLFHVASSATNDYIIPIAHRVQKVGAYSKKIERIILAHINLDLVSLWILSKL